MNTYNIRNLKAYIFDLDGTVVDSHLNFDKMRADLNFPKNAPILEELEKLTNLNEIKLANEIIHKHELEGAHKSTIMPGFLDLYQYIKDQKLPTGLLTRNSKVVTDLTLEMHNLKFDIVLTRDDCKAKPDPDGLNIMKAKWNIQNFEAIYIGDFQFDLLTAKQAHLVSGLYIPTSEPPFIGEADIIIKSYYDFLNNLKAKQET